MEHRKKINDQLVQWIRSQVETDYPENISLVCVYGSWLSGTMNRLSDVDCYFIPKTDRAYEFAQTFILEGVGYDIFPMSWERLEEIAKLDSPMQPLVGDVQILYCADCEIRERFRDLQRQMAENLENDAWVRRVAGEKCREAAQLLRNLEAESAEKELRKTAGRVSTLLAYVVTICSHEYNRLGMKKQYADLQRLAPWAANHYRGVVEAETAQAARREAEAFLEAVCAHLGMDVPAPEPEVKEVHPVEPDLALLAEIYQEICSTYNKIYISCEKGDPVQAYHAAGVLQYDLDESARFGCPDFDLLGSFDHRNLAAFSRTVRQAEETLLSLFQNAGIELKRYDSFADFAGTARE